MHLHQVVDPGEGVVVETRRCTAGSKPASFVRHVSIDISGTRLAGAFRPGQSFGVIPPGTDPSGSPHKLRLYSIASSSRGEDGQGRVIATTVKRLIDEHWDDHRLFLGVASNFLCDLKPGDKVQVTGPAGKRFLLPADPSLHDYLFIATGTGIAPFRGMVEDLAAAGMPGRATLIMGSPYRTDLLYHDEFRARASERFRYWPVVSRERQGEDAGEGAVGGKPMYVQDRLALARDEVAEMLAGGRTLIYICGIAGMELGIFQTLARLLPPETLGLYLDVDPEAMANIDGWDRKMIHKSVRPTKRVFLEVY